MFELNLCTVDFVDDVCYLWVLFVFAERPTPTWHRAVEAGPPRSDKHHSISQLPVPVLTSIAQTLPPTFSSFTTRPTLPPHHRIVQHCQSTLV